MIKLIFPMVILAVSLSLDALGVGVVYGLRKVRIPFNSKIIICLFSILYSGVAQLAGKAMAGALSPFIAKLIGTSILILMGTWIIIQALLKGDNNNSNGETAVPIDETILKFAVKSLGITIEVIRNPMKFDVDRSGSIDIPESLLLGLALSVDAIGVGIGSALVGFYSMVIPVMVGLFQLTFLYSGLYIGEKFAATWKINQKALSVLPGVLLICLALIRIY
jgi:putative sporulation protein YtaF